MAKKQKSGLYHSKVKIGVDAGGKPVNKWVSGRTQRELEEEKAHVRAYYIGGTGLRDDQLFGKYAADWFRTRKKLLKSDSTRASYRSMLNKHILPAFGDRNLRAISASALQDWLGGFEGMSDTTIIQAMTILRGIFSAAHADRIVANDPTAGLTAPCQPLPRSAGN
jgi:hypothetical protein